MTSNPDPGAGGRAARCAAADKDLDNDHAAAAARARRAMIGRGVRIGGLVRFRWIDPRHWNGNQLPGTFARSHTPRCTRLKSIAFQIGTFGTKVTTRPSRACSSNTARAAARLDHVVPLVV
jgi:hypothetical protein